MKSIFPGRQISPHRRALYYTGIGLMILGGLLFISTFFTFVSRFGDFTNFQERARSEGIRAVSGIALLIIGSVFLNIGARGAAGSGLLLDPEKAATDLEPWAKMSGKLTDTAFSEMETVRQTLANVAGGPAREVVKVRCRQCQALNDESDRFCGQCGAAMK